MNTLQQQKDQIDYDALEAKRVIDENAAVDRQKAVDLEVARIQKIADEEAYRIRQDRG